jgi:hypothetical protein
VLPWYLLAVAEGRVVTYRSTATRWVAAYLAGMYLLIFGAGIGALVGAFKASGTVEGTVLGIVAILLGLAGVAWSIFVVRFMGVRLVDGGVVVQNWVRRVKLPWDDIASFQYMDRQQRELSIREKLNTPKLQPYVMLESGRHVGLTGLTSTRVLQKRSREKVQRVLDALNQELAAHTTDSVTADSTSSPNAPPPGTNATRSEP